MSKNWKNWISVFVSFLIAGGVLYSLGLNLKYTGKWVAGQLGSIASLGNVSRNEKWEQQFGSYWYSYFRFVREHTPPRARILIPPLDKERFPWNVVRHNFFLQPRRIYQGSRPWLLKREMIDYVVTCGPFPDFPVEGERIMLDEKRGLIQIRK